MMHISLPSAMQQEAVTHIIKALDGKVQFVGGCVRNLLMQLPITDIDLATIWTPDQVIQRLSAHHIKVVETGIAFGTVTAVIEGAHYEITSLRKDIENDGRHAKVEYTDSYEDDAKRRDFTMNAIFCDQQGVISDYVGGVADAKAGMVRFVGNAVERCQEDHLRILRYFRFFAYYGKAPMDSEALNACQECASGMAQLSGERIAQEMLKLLAATDPSEVLQAMVKTHVLNQVCIPQTIRLDLVKRQAFLERKYALAINSMLRLALLLKAAPGNARSTTETLIARWKLSRVQATQLHYLVKAVPQNSSNIYDHYKQARADGVEFYIQALLLAWVQDIGANDDFYLTITEHLKQWQIPEFPVQGKDLLDIGFQPGKSIGDALRAAEYWWEERYYKPSKQEILEYIQKSD